MITGQNVKRKGVNAIRSYSNIIDRLMVKYNGVIVKYNKHRSVTDLVLEMRALMGDSYF